MVHPLPVELAMDVAMAAEQVGRENGVEHLGFLQAQDVGLLLGDQPLDQRRARTHRIDVPGSNLQPLSRGHALSLQRARQTKKAPAPGAWSEGRPSVCHARDPAGPGNRGKPQAIYRIESF